jgi:cytochrome c5
MSRRVAFVLAAACVVLAACGEKSAPKSSGGGALGIGPSAVAEPPLVENNLTPLQIKGRDQYKAECALCHEKGGPGSYRLSLRVGPEAAYIARRDDLDPTYIHNAARLGIGIMPRITRVEVTDENMDAIIAYLTRNNKPAGAAQ